ncbi:phosphotransferase [Paenibacillus rhizovicinus]|uniref:Phosphotransferase n=1 Tax=Paenibacillus rhizovicinus TaxID=2704463 RepID=A0A6C0NZL3_9BACL|nr:phosphotransferase [Paenibacillus rhizovicinus]QHW31685.1 phosphotransferase [Paenibacillus rhizovicinus]
MISNVVRPDGTLDEAMIGSRETLYTGMNGQRVERLILASGERVIFKPLTNDSQHGREAWVYTHLLPSFPAIYPRLLAYSGWEGTDGAQAGMAFEAKAAEDDSTASASGASKAGGVRWCLFEDLGTLSHAFEVDAAEALMPLIAQWHSLPVEAWLDAPFLGPKPMIEALLQTVLQQEAALRTALIGVPFGDELLERVLVPLRDGGEALPASWNLRVLSHGDLHLGNYARVNGAVFVLDWEHVHLNSPHWDLYHLLDLSHPVFPKALDASDRERLLDRYLTESEGQGMARMAADGFKQDYARFSAVFSLWMLLLIEKDLAALNRAKALPAKWSPEQLARQRTETLDSFVQCAEMLG